MPHWLFAFDAAGMAIMRTLAVLATHPEAAAKAEICAGAPAQLPYLRACVLDTLRLWPTTPALLRESTKRTPLGGRELPEDTTLPVFAPHFHRAVSNGFEPGLWLDGRARSHPALMLAAMRAQRDYELTDDHGLRDREHLPATLDNFHLEFRATAR